MLLTYAHISRYIAIYIVNEMGQLTIITLSPISNRLVNEACNSWGKCSKGGLESIYLL